MLKYKISLVYGDPSCDGHGMYETDYYYSSHSGPAIEAAILQSQKDHNWDWDCICQDYGQCSLTDDQYALFQKIGVDINSYVEHDDEEEYYNNYVHDFTGLYLAVARTIIPDLTTEPIKDDSYGIDIGGYGMLSQ